MVYNKGEGDVHWQENDNLASLEAMKDTAFQGGGVRRIEAQHKKGKLTARERIDLLLDEGSFEEFDLLKTGKGGDGRDEYPGDGVITGHGTIGGREVCIFSQDFTSLGGSRGEAHSGKIANIMDHAVMVGAPILCLKE